MCVSPKYRVQESVYFAGGHGSVFVKMGRVGLCVFASLCVCM